MGARLGENAKPCLLVRAVLGFKLFAVVLGSAIPLIANFYISQFVSGPTEFHSAFLHEMSIFLLLGLQAFITFITLQNYKRSREPFLRFLTLAFSGSAILALPLTLCAALPAELRIKFQIFASTSRLVMAVYLFFGVLHFKRAPEIMRKARDTVKLKPHIAFFIGLVGLLVVFLCVLPEVGAKQTQMMEFIVATFLTLSAAMLFYQRMKNKNLWSPLYLSLAFAILLFLQSSVCFLLSQPWDHHWWLGHSAFGAGFLVLSYAIIRAYETSHSFANVYNEAQLYRHLKSRTQELEAANAKLTLYSQRLNHSLQEITKSQESLRYSEERTRLIIETAHDAFVAIDSNNMIIDWNKQAEKTFGWSRREILGRNLFKALIAPQFGEMYEHNLQYFLATGIRPILDKRLEMTAVHKNGHQFPVEMTISPMPMGSSYIFNIFLHDITVRKQTEVALSRLAAIVESSQDAIIGKTLKGTIVSWNKGAERVYGYNFEEVKGKNISMLMAPADMVDMRELYHKIRNGEPIQYDEAVHVRKDGSQIYLSLSVSPIVDEAGNIIGISTIARDITEKRKIEEELHKAYDDLELRVQARTVELTQANEELTRLSQIKSDFTAMVSHELRIPLSAIKESIGLILDGISGSVNLEQKEILELAHRNVERLSRLINNVLDFNRLQSGRIEMHLEMVNMNELLTEVYKFMHPQVTSKKLGFILNTPDKVVNMVCDADKIRQVIINLVGNAVKFTENGGQILIQLKQNSSDIQISVNDTGMGIRQEDCELIFEMFRQVSYRGMWKTGGAGVGLAICKQIVEQHGGTITVDSAVGRGSHFKVSLPKTLQATEPLPAEMVTPTPPRLTLVS